MPGCEMPDPIRSSKLIPEIFLGFPLDRAIHALQRTHVFASPLFHCRKLETRIENLVSIAFVMSGDVAKPSLTTEPTN